MYNRGSTVQFLCSHKKKVIHAFFQLEFIHTQKYPMEEEILEQGTINSFLPSPVLIESQEHPLTKKRDKILAQCAQFLEQK
jgi:hypothetical protein